MVITRQRVAKTDGGKTMDRMDLIDTAADPNTDGDTGTRTDTDLHRPTRTDTDEHGRSADPIWRVPGGSLAGGLWPVVVAAFL